MEMSKSRAEDRISALPDFVLHHILSFLDMKEVVRTSVLSKNWQYICNSVPTLTFKYTDLNEEKTARFIAWVNKTLLLRENIAIKEFKVHLRYQSSFASDIDVWARFAAKNKVEKMSLHLDNGRTYSLPQYFCHNSSFTNLRIHGCRVVPSVGFCWTSLKKLSIFGMTVYGDTITKILLGSPKLESLLISSCKGSNGLYINSDSLRRLKICNWKDGPVAAISAPNVTFFHISGHLTGQIQFRLSFSSLLRAKITINLEYKDYDCVEQSNNLVEILENIRHVVELELGTFCIQGLSHLEEKTLSSPLSRLTCLKLNGFIDKQDVAGIISLLKCSPNLEKLVVIKTRSSSSSSSYGVKDSQQRSSSTFRKRAETCWEERKIEKFPLIHLKTVKFHGYEKLEDVDESTLALVHSLLENAKLLGSIVISVGTYQMHVTPHVV